MLIAVEDDFMRKHFFHCGAKVRIFVGSDLNYPFFIWNCGPDGVILCMFIQLSRAKVEV